MPFLLCLQAYLFSLLDHAFRHLTQPARSSLLLGTAADLALSQADLIAQNALLRHQLIGPQRHVKNPISPALTASGSSSWPLASPLGKTRC